MKRIRLTREKDCNQGEEPTMPYAYYSPGTTNPPYSAGRPTNMTPADLFERYWSRASRILVVALLALGVLFALALYLILA